MPAPIRVESAAAPPDVTYGRREGVVLALLVVGGLAVFAQTARFDFVSWDDRAYVTDNAFVLQGLGLEGVRWAFREAGNHGNWQPIAYLSHMLDVELFGLAPAGHHGVNVCLHLLNTLLLFHLLRSTTRNLWPSALVAALFSIHPLHVESVAWIAERKDVLSTFWALLSMLAYVRYARGGGPVPYLGTVSFFVLGLLTKPSVVTLPFVLLLLDIWPLERMGGDWRRTLVRLVGEKTPLFVLSLVASVLRYQASRVMAELPRVVPTGYDLDLPLYPRVANAVWSYAAYLGQAIWPKHLVMLYPHPYIAAEGGVPLSPLQVAGAAALLLAISAIVFWIVPRRYAIVGWLWYLGTLVPMIGLVQEGLQARADRYTYVSLIGIFIAVVWAGNEAVEALRRRWRGAPALAAGIAAALLVPLGVVAWQQARVWSDSLTLYGHALEVYPGSRMLNFNFAVTLSDRGRIEEALPYYRTALEVDPDFFDGHYALGAALEAQGDPVEATRHQRRAVQLDPSSADAHFALARTLQSRGKHRPAIRHFTEGLELEPDPQAHHRLGQSLQAVGDFDGAIEQYRLALELRPDLAEARRDLSRLQRDRQGAP